MSRVEMHDVVIAGGGPAGLSAALLLGRARRRVLVCDTGQPRNALSHALNGFVTRDGIEPARFRRIAREQLKRYPTVEYRREEAVDVTRRGEHFEVTFRRNAEARCRAVLLATGRIDILPAVDGAVELFGRGVYPCPYCDGWEHRDQPIAVYGNAHANAALDQDRFACGCIAARPCPSLYLRL